MPALQKPRVMCHMIASLDGRIIVQRWGDSQAGPEYEATAATYDAQAWLCGRVTMEKDFTHGCKSGRIDGDHLIEVLTEQVGDEYLAYLRLLAVEQRPHDAVWLRYAVAPAT